MVGLVVQPGHDETKELAPASSASATTSLPAVVAIVGITMLVVPLVATIVPIATIIVPFVGAVPSSAMVLFVGSDNASGDRRE
jgi:hypothetical protein